MSLKQVNIGENILNIAGKMSDVKESVEDVSEILKTIDNIGDMGKALNIAGVSKDTADAALHLIGMGDAVSDVTNAMDSFAGSQKGIKGIGEAFKGLGNGILGFVKSNWVAIAAIAAIGTAIGIAYQQITKFSRSVEKAKESQSNYSSTISELQSLESEIDTTSSKIDELNSKGTLTLVEKSELQNLKLQNAELERQRDIKQKIADTQSRESIDDAMESLNMVKTTDLTQKTMQQQLLESNNWMDRVAAGQISSAGIQNMVYEKTDIVTATQNEVKALNDLKEAREKLYLERDNESTTKKRKESIDSEISELEAEIDRYDSEVVKNMEALQELRNNFIEESTQLPRSNLTTKELQKYNSITDILDEYVNNDPFAKQAEALSEIWKDDSFAQAQQKLVDAFRTGKDLSVDEITNQFPDLVSACNDAGISVSTLREELMALASQDSGATKLEEDFMSFQTSLISAINVVDTLNGALANSFSGKGLNVEIDEETGAIVGDIANIKAAYQGLEGYDASALFEKTANGVHINREALRALQAQQESLQKATNLEKIAELQKQLNEAMTDAKSKVGTEDYASSQLIVNDLKARLEIAQELAAAYDGATSAYQKWINAQSNGEEGDMFRTVSETMRERGNELYTEGRYNTNEFRAIADYFSNQDLSTASVEELVRAYEAAKPTIDSFFTGNKQGIDNFMASMKQMSDEGNLGWIEELENGAMKFNVSTKELADSLGISQEAVEGLLRAADEYTPIVLASDASVDFTNSIDEMQKKAEEAKSRLEELNNNGQVDLNLDFNFNSTDVGDLENQIDRAKSNLEQFKNQDGTVDLNIKGAEDAVAILTTLIHQKQQVSQPAIMSIQTDGLDDGVSNIISKLQEYYTAVNELSGLQELQSVGININDSQIDSAKAKVADLYSEIQGMSQNGNLQINADVSVDASSAESLTHDLEAMSPEIKAKIVPDASGLNDKEDYDKESTVTLKKDSSEPDEYEPEDKEAEVKYSVDASRVNSWRPPAKTGTVTYNIRTAGSLPQNLTRTVTYNTVVTSVLTY